MAATFRKVGLSLALFPAPSQCSYVHSFWHLQNFQAEKPVHGEAGISLGTGLVSKLTEWDANWLSHCSGETARVKMPTLVQVT